MKLGELIDFNPKRLLEKGALTPFIEMADLPVGERDVSGIGNRVFNGGGSKFKNGDTLFARITPCLENGKTAKVRGLSDNAVAHGSTEFIVMSAKDPEIDENFVYYVARHPEFRAYAKGQMEGTSGRQRVSWQAISDYEIPDFSRLERSRIGSVLSSIDNLISSNRRINQSLEAIARTFFKAWFVDFEPVLAKMEGRWQHGQSLPGLPAHLYDLFPARLVDSELGEIPEGWEIGRVADFLSLAYGKSLPAGSRNPGVVPVYGSGGVTGYHDTSFLNGEAVIVGRKGTVGSLYWEPLPCFPIDTVFYVQPLVPLPFCYHLLQSLPLSDMNTDAAVPGLNRENVYRLEVAAPPQALIEEFSGLVRKFRDQIFNLHAEARIFAQLRDTLLPKLLSGELRVLDAEHIIGVVV